MTAVAVVTPSSGSYSAATPLVVWLPWVVGADTVSSSYVACGDVLFVASRAGLLRGDRSSIEAHGGRSPSGEGACPGATTEDRPGSGRTARCRGLAERVPHERG